MESSHRTADVSVVGLGRVGLPLALSFADRGLRVIGIDNDPARLGAVGDARMPFSETGAQQRAEALEQRALVCAQGGIGQRGHATKVPVPDGEAR